MLSFIGFISAIFLKVIALFCPLLCMSVLIKEEFKTLPEKLIVVCLAIIFGIFLYYFL